MKISTSECENGKIRDNGKLQRGIRRNREKRQNIAAEDGRQQIDGVLLLVVPSIRDTYLQWKLKRRRTEEEEDAGGDSETDENKKQRFAVCAR